MAPRNSPPKNLTDLRYYKNFLYSKTVTFPCPRCNNAVLPKDYEKHCADAHGLNTRLCCAWCLGKVSWPSKEKCLNTKHLKECAQRFLISNLPRSRRVSFDRSPLCPKKQLFGRARDPQPGVYESLCPIPLSPTPLTFDIESLNTASSCLRTYLEVWKTTYWAHVIVRAVAFQSFLEAMKADEGRTRTLPFSCWCDGGKDLEARHRQHRHLIVASLSQEHFERNVWRKIKIAREDRPRGHFRIKHKDPIKSASHLVHILGYVSKRESICEFSGDKQNEKQNHYYIFESLPKDYRLALVLQWKRGLRKQLELEFKNLKWEELVRSPMERVDGKWQVKIKDIPGIALGKVLPVSPHFIPCDHPTDYFVYLLRGKKLYFDRLPEPMEPEAWLAVQLERGNCFHDRVGEETWIQRPFHQKLINAFKPYVDRNAQLEVENASLRGALDKAQEAAERQLAQSRGQHEAEVAQLNGKHELEVAELNGKHEAEVAELNGKHELEVARLKATAVQEAKDLLKKINELHEREIARLRTELAEARRKICLLENELAGADDSEPKRKIF